MKVTAKCRIRRLQESKLGHVPILSKPVAEIRPSPENDKLYRPIDPTSQAIQELAKSIRQYGVREPLVITIDGFILSGHRRFAAATLAGLLSVPVRIEPIRRIDDIDGFVRLLREYNRQREKSFDERIREELVSTDPDEAYQSLIDHRATSSTVLVEPLAIVGTKRRSEISDAKKPFLEAVQRVLEGRREFWPLSDRQVHYALLNDPPLKHASKPASIYGNNLQSYKTLCDLLTRARLAGLIPMEAIGDETRPVTNWDVSDGPANFIGRELDNFLKGYWRNLLQSQPNHIEIVGEKNTLAGILRPVAARYCIPMTIGRGYCSLPPRHAMAQRFARSGKEKLIVLLVSDFDPDGEEIAASFARSLRDDFGIESVHPIKVALTTEQVERFQLPPVMKAKHGSAQYEKFSALHGDSVFEVEALDPKDLQDILSETIDSVIDRELFNRELDAEKRDAAFLQTVRVTVKDALRDVPLDAEGGDSE